MDNEKQLLIDRTVDRIVEAKNKFKDGMSKLYSYHCFLYPDSEELGFREHDTNSGPDDFLNKQKTLFNELNEELELICRDLED